jgi:hypothetical protein
MHKAICSMDSRQRALWMLAAIPDLIFFESEVWCILCKSVLMFRHRDSPGMNTDRNNYLSNTCGFDLSGSRNREGKTARAINAICRGIQYAKGESEVIFLPELKLERCRQCNPDGQGPCVENGLCVIKDDFAAIAEKVRAADVLVCANPVYFGDLTESLRALWTLPPNGFVPPTLLERSAAGKGSLRSVCVMPGGGGIAQLVL